MTHSKEILLGAFLAVAAYAIVFGAITPAVSIAYAANQPIFSMTLLAPTSNPVRRQYASIIATSFQSVGIGAQVIYVTFSELIPRLFFESASNCTQAGADFAHGGYDVGFIGWGATGIVPDTWVYNFLGTCSNMAPIGNNYYLYNNSEVNQLINDLEHTVNTTRQSQDVYKIQEIVKNDSPNDVIYYTDWVIARAPQIQDYGNNNTWSEISFPDVQHYSGVTTLNFAEAGNVFPQGNLNPLPVSSSNSFYALFMYSPVFAGLQEIDSRSNTLYKALATSITSTPDGLNWTITFRPHNFQDGVPVTSDDYVFTYMSEFDPYAGSVGLSTYLTQLGNVGYFTFSSPSVANFVFSHLNGSNPVTPDSGISLSGSTIVIDQSAGSSKIPFYVKAVSPTTFTFNLTQAYAFFNLTYTTIAAFPMHYLGWFAQSSWSQLPYSLANGPDTYPNGTVVKAVDPGGLWDGKPISGPFGDGPYIFTGFDTTTNTAHLVQFNNYWNATGLRSIGQFTVKYYNVVWINGADAAISAFKTGTVNQLDTNYALAAYVSQLKSIGANVLMGPELGLQEMGVNMRHPVFGTGLATPAGQANPANAAQAARDIRRAFSYLIPRQLIINNLLNGLGTPGASMWSPAYGPLWVNPNVTADPYNPAQAAQLLQAAGYSPSNYTPPPPPPPPPPSAVVVNQLASPITVSGNLTDPTTHQPIVAANLTLQYTTDSRVVNNVTLQTTLNSSIEQWYNTGITVLTGAGGYYSFSWTPPTQGTYYLRFINAPTRSSVLFLGNFTSKPSYLNLSDYVRNALQGYATSAQVAQVQQSVTALSSNVQTLTSEISSLQSSLNTATYVSYGSIIVAILAILVAIFVAARRK